jgi:hypothetical protein
MAHACYVCSFYPVPDGEGVECSHCHRLQYGNKCPRCGQTAPTRVKDFRVFCTACGFERGALSGNGIAMPINMVGKPSQFGGIATRVLGTAGLAVTLLLVTFVTIAAVAYSSTILGALAVLLATFGSVAAFLLMRGGKKLQQQGERAQHDAREQAVAAAAKARGGAITAAEAAAVLEVHVAEADALLTAIAKEGARAHVEISNDGVVKYVFHEAAPVHVAPTTAAQPVTGVRVDTQTPVATSQSADPKQVAQQRVDREFEELKKTRAAKGD